jgi:hypothetical protein
MMEECVRAIGDLLTPILRSIAAGKRRVVVGHRRLHNFYRLIAAVGAADAGDWELPSHQLGHHPDAILNSVRRLSILVVALLVGAAAPARAWCEATCLAPAAHSESAKPHCPAHESSSKGPSLSAAGIADCASIESARPAPAKLELNHSILTAALHLRTAALLHLRTSAPSHVRSSSFFERAVPLRI